MNKFLQTLLSLKVGDRLIVPKSAWDIVQHHAIYMGYRGGHYWFIENKENIGVRLVTAGVFLNGVIKITEVKRFIPRENYTRDDLYAYALTKRGKAYNLLSYNCEHLANELQHRVVKSKQADTGVGLALFSLALLLIGAASGGSNKRR